jgi:hypothetical protein
MKRMNIGFLILSALVLNTSIVGASEPQWPNQKFVTCSARVSTLLLSKFSKEYGLPPVSDPEGQLNGYGLELEANARNICRLFLAGEELQAGH